MNNLNDLRVWRKAVDLAVDIYKITADFPHEERFGLKSQIRRAVISISSNIAEGAGRNTVKEFNNFLGIASGSSYELQSQLIISNKLLLVNDQCLKQALTDIQEIQKMCFGLQRNLNKS